MAETVQAAMLVAAVVAQVPQALTPQVPSVETVATASQIPLLDRLLTVLVAVAAAGRSSVLAAPVAAATVPVLMVRLLEQGPQTRVAVAAVNVDLLLVRHLEPEAPAWSLLGWRSDRWHTSQN